jgi:energy-coupling factor transport system permease protein
MYLYQEKDSLLHKVHPLSLIMYVFTISVFAFVFSHPFYLFGLFISVTLVVLAADIFEQWLIYLKLSLVLIMMILLINSLFVQVGSTVLFWGPYIPGIGKIRITLEAICYGLNMGLRFLIVISAFCLLTYVLHPDRGLKLIGSLGNKSVLALTITTRLFPLLVSDLQRIYDVHRCRGLTLQGKNKFAQVKGFFPIFNALILSSLERSFELAEALQARGYGVGKRTSYNQEIFRPRDYIIIVSLILSIIIGLLLAWQGYTSFTFYPRLQVTEIKEGIYAFLYSLFFICPALLDWGWQKYPILKSKI